MRRPDTRMVVESRWYASFWVVRNGLDLAVLFFQLSLHVKVQLSLPLYALLFHIAEYACVHGLNIVLETRQ